MCCKRLAHSIAGSRSANGALKGVFGKRFVNIVADSISLRRSLLKR
jgi:hypothetical protein